MMVQLCKTLDPVPEEVPIRACVYKLHACTLKYALHVSVSVRACRQIGIALDAMLLAPFYIPRIY